MSINPGLNVTSFYRQVFVRNKILLYCTCELIILNFKMSLRRLFIVSFFQKYVSLSQVADSNFFFYISDCSALKDYWHHKYMIGHYD